MLVLCFYFIVQNKIFATPTLPEPHPLFHGHSQGHTHSSGATPILPIPHPVSQGHTHCHRATPTVTGPHPLSQGHTRIYRPMATHFSRSPFTPIFHSNFKLLSYLLSMLRNHGKEFGKNLVLLPFHLCYLTNQYCLWHKHSMDFCWEMFVP